MSKIDEQYTTLPAALARLMATGRPVEHVNNMWSCNPDAYHEISMALYGVDVLCVTVHHACGDHMEWRLVWDVSVISMLRTGKMHKEGTHAGQD